MPIYHTNTFWNYISNESVSTINRIKETLTFKQYNFDTKKYEFAIFFQEISNIKTDFGDYITLRFPAGLTNFLIKELKLSLEELPSKTPLYTPDDIKNTVIEFQKNNASFEARDYQAEAALTAVNNFQCMVESGIGTGKTSILSIICNVLKNNKILIINNRNFILQQIYDRLLSFGITDVDYNIKKPDFSKRIVILNSAGSNSKLLKKDEEYINYLKTVNTIIYDECHHVNAFTFFSPIFYTDIDNLKHIIGFSGSPFRNTENPYKTLEDFRTIAILSEPKFVYKMAKTIADGNIAQPYGYFIRFKNIPNYLPPQYESNYFMQYRSNITYNKNRNTAGFEMLKFLNKYNIKTLASFNNLSPAKNIMKQCVEAGIKCILSTGNETFYEWKKSKRGVLKLEKRQGNAIDIRAALESEYNIIFASQVLDEGVDIDIFQAAVLFSAGKTPISGIQRIGRASRKKKEGMNVSLIIDFTDLGGYYIFEDHFYKRKKMMEEAGIKILSNVQDFMNLVKTISESK